MKLHQVTAILSWIFKCVRLAVDKDDQRLALVCERIINVIEMA